MEYTAQTEPASIYHRWCCISSIGALIGRKNWINFGHTRIFPNLFLMLMGEPGARKSTSVKIIRDIVQRAGYLSIAADKTTKEKFLLDLEGLETEEMSGGYGQPGHNSSKYDATTANNLWGNAIGNKDAREVFVMADEFNEFSGVNNQEFYTTLGKFWDWDDEISPYKQRLKNSRSIAIWQPTVSILGGNTQELFARAFPPEIIGTGFLSRLLLIHGEKSARKFTIPPSPDAKQREALVSNFSTLLRRQVCEITYTVEAYDMLDALYRTWQEIDDYRFKGYNSRRLTQLLKVAISVVIARGINCITRDEVIAANTYLSAAERNMPKALGEFGKSRNSDIANIVYKIIESAEEPINILEIFPRVSQEVETAKDLGDIISKLIMANKVQQVKGYGGKTGLLPKRNVMNEHEFVDLNLLTTEEREML